MKANWEGPYVIADEGSKGAYRIQSQNGHETRPWSSAYLKKYCH